MLKTFLYLGYFVNDMSKVPLKIVSMLAAQLDLDAESIRRYNKLNSVKGYHIKLIKKYYGISTFDADSRELIFKWLLDQFKITSDYDNIVRSCIQMIKSEHKELPSLNVIESLVDIASESMSKKFYDYFDKNLTLIQKNRMNELVKKLPENKRKSEFSLLKYVPGKPNIVTLSKHIKMQSRLKDFQLSEKIMERIPIQKLEWFAHQGKKYNIKDLRRFHAAKRHTIIACFIYKSMEDTMKNIIDILLKRVNVSFNNAQANFIKNLQKHAPSTKKRFKEYGNLSKKIAKSYDNPKILYKEVTTFKTRDEFQLTGIEVDQYYFERSDTYCYLPMELTKLRRYFQKVLNVIRLNCDDENIIILEMLELIKNKWKNKNTRIKITEDLKKFVEPEWKSRVFPEDGEFDWKYFELCVLTSLASALKCGDVWVEGSLHYSPLKRFLITEDEWGQFKPVFLKELSLPAEPEKVIERLKNGLHNAWEKFNSSYNQNRYIRIKSGKLSITPLDREKQPPRLNYIKLKIFEAIGDVNLTDILMDVQLMTNFCSNFRHMGGWKKDSLKVSNEKLLATMHSVGCNLGPAQTKKSTVFSEKQITNTRNSFFSERNITNAKNQVVNTFSRLRITNNWGDGSSVSADGRLIKMADKNLMASWNVKYHGIGGMLYTHVSDKYIAIYSQFIHCGVYEAEYILDAIFNEEKIDIKPYKIHADTHGQTEMVFAFCFLLGIQLMPRIRNIKDYTLCKPDSSYKYKYVDSLASKPIDWQKIYGQLDQMLRLCASIRKGKVRSSFALKKMSAQKSTNKLYEAFKELGKVVKTIYILEYAGSKELRRMVQLGCNKAEMWHNFQKFIYFGQSGELRTNDTYEQREATKVLELLGDAIALWNAIKIGEVVDELRKQGEKISDSDVKFITPLITRHINRFGKFDFDLEKRRRELK